MKKTTIIPGVLFALVLAIAAWFAGKLVPVIGGAVFAILFGLVVGQFFRPAPCAAGLKFTSKKILQYAIIFLGFEMQIQNVLTVGSRSLLIMLFTLTAAFVTAFAMYRALRVPGKQAVLIGVGTCICGGSAIAATAPVIDADDRDIAQSISTIFLFNIIAVFAFPALGRLLHLSDTGFGLWAGTAINDTSSVVAAASAWSEAAGNSTALSLATIVKLTRTLLIIPVTIVLAIYTARSKRGAGSGSFSIVKIFPWFVIGFVVAAIINSFVPLPAGVPHFLATCGKFMIVMAMAAIGLSTDVRSLVASGWRPIALGAAAWFAVAVVSLAVQNLSGLL
jgi:uncharacterized integral membrane protein (TIGR00698 family)